MKWVVLVVVGIILLIGIELIFYNQPPQEKTELKLYQGPIPEGFNETHFRQTGETIREVIE